MRVKRMGVLILTLTLLTLTLTRTRNARADATRVRLRGSAHIDAHGARAEGDELILEGTLRDDAGEPIANEPVTMTLARASTGAAGPPIAFAEDRSGPRGCVSGGGEGITRTNATTLALKTTGDGHFCVRVPMAVDRYVARLAWSGSPLVDEAKLDLAIDLSRRAIVLRFDPEPRVVFLTGGMSSLEAVAAIDDNGNRTPGGDLPLLLSNERGATIASATTNGAGLAHFPIDPSRLGPPGRGELRVAFGGNADSAATAHVAEIERHTRVELRVEGAEGDLLKPGSPDEGVAFVVAARSPSGDVPNGSVEARVAGQLVGAAAVEHGQARVVVTFAAEAANGAEAAIDLRYAPSAPWFEPGPPTIVRLPLRGPSPWRQVPLVLAGLAVVAWFVLGRTARARDTLVAPPRPKPISKGHAKIDVVRVARDPRSGWSGRVIDAHDGEPVPSARVAIERPGFGRVEVIASTIAGEFGRFELRAPGEAHASDELAIEAPLHSELRQRLPPTGEIEVSLVLRKRALLARLVSWAKQRGRPFDARPEPTPGHVRKSAGKDFNLARWADAIERAAFSGATVDARAEAEVNKMAPPAVPAYGPSAAPSPAEEFAKMPPGKAPLRVDEKKPPKPNM
jgi:hypothetical protein